MDVSFLDCLLLWIVIIIMTLDFPFWSNKFYQVEIVHHIFGSGSKKSRKKTLTSMNNQTFQGGEKKLFQNERWGPMSLNKATWTKPLADMNHWILIAW